MTDDDLGALAEVDRAGRIGRTTVQVGIPTALVTIGTWAARLADLDLNPDDAPDATDLPIEVSGAFVAILTVALAFAMNRRPPAPSPATDTIETAVAVADDGT